MDAVDLYHRAREIAKKTNKPHIIYAECRWRYIVPCTDEYVIDADGKAAKYKILSKFVKQRNPI